MNASILQNRVLLPVLDAQALNEHQQALLDNPGTLEMDSVIELSRLVKSASERMIKLAEQALESNAIERAKQQEVAGFADKEVTSLRTSEIAGNSATLSGRALAQLLIKDLDAIQDANDALSIARCALSIGLTIQGISTERLFRPAVTGHLKPRRTQLLKELLDGEGV